MVLFEKDTNTLLLMFIGSRPIPQPNRGYDVP
jgi:hypothetical protein